MSCTPQASCLTCDGTCNWRWPLRGTGEEWRQWCRPRGAGGWRPGCRVQIPSDPEGKESITVAERFRTRNLSDFVVTPVAKLWSLHLASRFLPGTGCFAFCSELFNTRCHFLAGCGTWGQLQVEMPPMGGRFGVRARGGCESALKSLAESDYKVVGYYLIRCWTKNQLSFQNIFQIVIFTLNRNQCFSKPNECDTVWQSNGSETEGSDS